MVETTYVPRELAKMAGSHFIAGSGNIASSITAAAKVSALSDILQDYFQDRDFEFDGTEIEESDVKKAIAYARGKKESKAIRKGVIGTAQFGLQAAATVGGATVGSVIPGLGTVLGGVGGAVAGASLGVGVLLVDRLKRTTKGIYKWAKGTRGEHRKQAAFTLLSMAKKATGKKDAASAAYAALVVILGDEFDDVMKNERYGRLADRLKSN
ncbi:hypothetical protein [Falsiroseomonas oryziterrae]|uniref:hypothetical protein n=1 Tax=Falsiroseomonas oryziterrae TaxID=2911368 RepID=UPI001F3B3514|nr:hypothetical protein [Roseomonas sp. NPKOSM-4]